MVCKRRKAFIGTAISLGANIIGGIIGGAKKRQAEEEQRQFQLAQNRATEGNAIAQNLTNVHSNDYNTSLENRRLYTSSLFKKGGEIYIKPSKRGTFTDAAKKRGQSVQGFASKVLANENNYSPAMVKKARFAKNASKWHHLLGGVSNLFRYGGSSKFSKRPTKQNLGLENPNKTGKNSPTAYRSTSNASSVASLSSLRSDDKVVQKALESLMSSSPVKEQEDARTSYRTGGEVKQRQLGDSPFDDPTFAFTRKRFDIRKNAHGAKSLNVSVKGFRTIKALSKTLRSASPILEFLQNTIPSKESEYAEEIRKYSSDVAKGKDKKLEENKYMKVGGEVKRDTTARINKPDILDEEINRYSKRANTEKKMALRYALDNVKNGKSANDFIYPGYSIKAINQLDSITNHPKIKLTNLKSRGRLREHYDPITNTIYRQPGLYHRVSPAEYSHAYRNSKNNEFVSAIKDYVKHPYITPEGYNKLYNTKGSYEYDAHKVVEPVLRDFLKGKFPVDSLDIKIDERRKQFEKGGVTSIQEVKRDTVKTNNKYYENGKWKTEPIKASKEKQRANGIFSGIVSVVDPTGISSYGTLASSIANREPVSNIISNVFSSLPVVGKIGKGARLVFKNNTLNKLSKSANRLLEKDRILDASVRSQNNASRYFNQAEELASKQNHYWAKKNREWGKNSYNKASRFVESYYNIKNSPINKYNNTVTWGKSSLNSFKTLDSSKPVNSNEYKKGGIASINPIIQEGGDAIKLKPNTFLLRGRKHRNGGIVIGKGRNSIEAEGGEVVKVDKNTMKILSTVPMANGESPAARVVKGENPDKVFQSQETFKNINNLSNSKFRYGGTNKQRDNSNRTDSIHPTFRSINSVSKEDRINTKAKTINGTTYDFDRIFPKKFNSNSSTKYSSNNYNDSVTNNYINRNLGTIQTATNSITHFPLTDVVTARSPEDVIGAFFGLAETGPKAFVQDYIKNKYYPNEESIIKVNSMEKSKDKFRYGGLKRRKAALGAKEIFNIAGDAFNVLSPLIGGSKTKKAINQMSAPSQPQQYQAARLRTNYNINPQLTDIRTSELDALAETNRNTASSVAAQARNMRIRNLGLSQRNQLRGQKENIETQLINQDVTNRQQVANQNIAQTNDWRNRVSQFVNDRIVSKANVDNQMIEGVSSGIRDIQSRIDKNQQEKNALTAIMASNPEQVDLFMKKRKEYENLLDRNSNSLFRFYYLGGLKNKRKSKVR